MWKHSREDPMEPLAAELTLECEALLAGRYAEHLRRQGRWAPPWAWLNALAHLSEEALADLATARPDPQAGDPTGTREWRTAVAFLAEDVLRHVRSTGIPLRQLQASTLIPLELQLMAGADGPTLKAGQLAGIVLAAVHRHPSRRDP